MSAAPPLHSQTSDTIAPTQNCFVPTDDTGGGASPHPRRIRDAAASPQPASLTFAHETGEDWDAESEIAKLSNQRISAIAGDAAHSRPSAFWSPHDHTSSSSQRTSAPTLSITTRRLYESFNGCASSQDKSTTTQHDVRHSENRHSYSQAIFIVNNNHGNTNRESDRHDKHPSDSASYAEYKCEPPSHPYIICENNNKSNNSNRIISTVQDLTRPTRPSVIVIDDEDTTNVTSTTNSVAEDDRHNHAHQTSRDSVHTHQSTRTSSPVSSLPISAPAQSQPVCDLTETSVTHEVGVTSTSNTHASRSSFCSSSSSCASSSSLLSMQSASDTATTRTERMSTRASCLDSEPSTAAPANSNSPYDAPRAGLRANTDAESIKTRAEEHCMHVHRGGVRRVNGTHKGQSARGARSTDLENMTHHPVSVPDGARDRIIARDHNSDRHTDVNGTEGDSKVVESNETEGDLAKGMNRNVRSNQDKDGGNTTSSIDAIPTMAQSAEELAEVSLHALLATLSPDQRTAYDMCVHHHRSVFITGGAGTGKSHLLRVITRALPFSTTFVTATTGLAALQLSGTTLHSFAGCNVVPTDMPWRRVLHDVMGKARAVRAWRRCRVLVIDEVSMLSAWFLDLLDYVAQHVRRRLGEPFGGVQLIFTGDFLQLPPVMAGRFGEGRRGAAERAAQGSHRPPRCACGAVTTAAAPAHAPARAHARAHLPSRPGSRNNRGAHHSTDDACARRHSQERRGHLSTRDGSCCGTCANGNRVVCHTSKSNAYRIADDRCGDDYAHASFCFESEAWLRINPLVCCLTTSHRQKNAAFFALLNEMRVGHPSAETVARLNAQCGGFDAVFAGQAHAGGGALPTATDDQTTKDTWAAVCGADVHRGAHAARTEDDGQTAAPPVTGRRQATSTSEEDATSFTMLRPTRAEVDGVNATFYNRLTTEEFVYRGHHTGVGTFPAAHLPAQVQLRVGCRVMLIKNCERHSGLVNGSTGVVVGFVNFRAGYLLRGSVSDLRTVEAVCRGRGGDGTVPHTMLPMVRFDPIHPPAHPTGVTTATATHHCSTDSSAAGDTAATCPSSATLTTVVEPQEWREMRGDEVVSCSTQIPLILAYAITIHKAQGMSLRRVDIDFARIFESGQAYVALSRCTDAHTLRLRGLEVRVVRSNTRALAYYQALQLTHHRATVAHGSACGGESMAMGGAGELDPMTSCSPVAHGGFVVGDRVWGTPYGYAAMEWGRDEVAPAKTNAYGKDGCSSHCTRGNAATNSRNSSSSSNNDTDATNTNDTTHGSNRGDTTTNVKVTGVHGWCGCCPPNASIAIDALRQRVGPLMDLVHDLRGWVVQRVGRVRRVWHTRLVMDTTALCGLLTSEHSSAWCDAIFEVQGNMVRVPRVVRDMLCRRAAVVGRTRGNALPGGGRGAAHATEPIVESDRVKREAMHERARVNPSEVSSMKRTTQPGGGGGGETCADDRTRSEYALHTECKVNVEHANLVSSSMALCHSSDTDPATRPDGASPERPECEDVSDSVCGAEMAARVLAWMEAMRVALVLDVQRDDGQRSELPVVLPEWQRFAAVLPLLAASLDDTRPQGAHEAHVAVGAKRRREDESSERADSPSMVVEVLRSAAEMNLLLPCDRWERAQYRGILEYAIFLRRTCGEAVRVCTDSTILAAYALAFGMDVVSVKELQRSFR